MPLQSTDQCLAVDKILQYFGTRLATNLATYTIFLARHGMLQALRQAQYVQCRQRMSVGEWFCVIALASLRHHLKNGAVNAALIITIWPTLHIACMAAVNAFLVKLLHCI